MFNRNSSLQQYAFQQIKENLVTEFLILSLKSELIFSNFNDKLLNFVRTCEMLRIKSQARYFKMFKSIIIENNLVKNVKENLELEKKNYLEKNFRIQEEIKFHQNKIGEKEESIISLRIYCQNLEKTFLENDKIIEDKKFNKMKKTPNIFQKIEGIESQVDK